MLALLGLAVPLRLNIRYGSRAARMAPHVTELIKTVKPSGMDKLSLWDSCPRGT